MLVTRWVSHEEMCPCSCNTSFRVVSSPHRLVVKTFDEFSKMVNVVRTFDEFSKMEIAQKIGTSGTRLVLTPLQSASKMHERSFVPSSRIFVWGATTRAFKQIARDARVKDWFAVQLHAFDETYPKSRTHVLAKYSQIQVEMIDEIFEMGSPNDDVQSTNPIFVHVFSNDFYAHHTTIYDDLRNRRELYCSPNQPYATPPLFLDNLHFNQSCATPLHWLDNLPHWGEHFDEHFDLHIWFTISSKCSPPNGGDCPTNGEEWHTPDFNDFVKSINLVLRLTILTKSLKWRLSKKGEEWHTAVPNEDFEMSKNMWVRPFVSTSHTINYSIWAKSDENCLQKVLPTYFSTFQNRRLGSINLLTF